MAAFDSGGYYSLDCGILPKDAASLRALIRPRQF